MNRYTAVCVVLFLGFLNPSYGHDIYSPSFRELDSDQDSTLTIVEISNAIDLYFTAHDANRNGLLTINEFPSDKNQLRAGLNRVPKKKAMPDPVAQADALLERLDADENGGLSFEELNGTALKRFAAQDSDGDGELSGEELQVSMMARVEKRNSKAKKPLSRRQKMFAKWDANGDGSIAKAELPIAKIQKNVAKIFADLDVNEDTKVSMEEFSVIKN